MQHDSTTCNMIQQHTTRWSNGTNFFFTTNVACCCMKSSDRLTGALKQNSAPPLQPKCDTFSFTADQLVKFVATVAIQIAQPQVCYTNAPKDAVDKKSSLCRRVSEAAKSQPGISISGSTLFDAIGSVCAPALSASKIPVVIPEHFRFFASTKPSAKKPINQFYFKHLVNYMIKNKST